jgi:sialic acid synthase SpsE
MEGPDHLSSLDPTHFSEFVKKIHLIELLKGEKYKKPTRSELLNKVSMRRSLVLIKDKKRGEKIRESDLGFRRPGTGIPIKEIYTIIGRKLKNSQKKGYMLSYDDI